MPGLVGLVDRLGREPEMLPHIFGRGGASDAVTSLRKRSKCRSIRHIAEAIQPKPPSMNTIFNRGKRSGMPSITRLASCAAIVCAVRLMLLAIIRRPAAAGRRMGRHSRRHEMPSGRSSSCARLVDRPVAASAERLVGARRETLICTYWPVLAQRSISASAQRRIVLPDQD